MTTVGWRYYLVRDERTTRWTILKRRRRTGKPWLWEFVADAEDEAGGEYTLRAWASSQGIVLHRTSKALAWKMGARTARPEVARRATSRRMSRRPEPR